MHGHLELVDILVNNSADLEAEDKLGMTPLLVAVSITLTVFNVTILITFHFNRKGLVRPCASG